MRKLSPGSFAVVAAMLDAMVTEAVRLAEFGVIHTVLQLAIGLYKDCGKCACVCVCGRG